MPATWRDMAVLPPSTGEERYLELLAEAYEAQQVSTTEILETLSGAEAIRRLMEHAAGHAGHYASECLEATPPQQPVACKKGCEHCCFSTVGVVASEVIHLADRLRAVLSEEDLARLRERAEDRAETLQAMSRGERLQARVPCALLRNGACSAYEHRPLVCRWACSSSLQSCLDHLVHKTTSYLEMEQVRYLPVQEVWRGHREGLRSAGLDASLLALNSALALALATPDAAERYLAGEPVFEGARL